MHDKKQEDLKGPRMGMCTDFRNCIGASMRHECHATRVSQFYCGLMGHDLTELGLLHWQWVLLAMHDDLIHSTYNFEAISQFESSAIDIVNSATCCDLQVAQQGSLISCEPLLQVSCITSCPHALQKKTLACYNTGYRCSVHLLAQNNTATAVHARWSKESPGCT